MLWWRRSIKEMSTSQVAWAKTYLNWAHSLSITRKEKREKRICHRWEGGRKPKARVTRKLSRKMLRLKS